tara:strand:- start:643 stop:1617 length:975 start_codon:yes stop_codon:yes gene_type:complete
MATKSIALSFKNGIGNYLMLTPTITALQNNGFEVSILLGNEENDPRKEGLELLIESAGLKLFDKEEIYDHYFYVWGEPARNVPMDKKWNITSRATNPTPHFTQGVHEVDLNYDIARHFNINDEIPNMSCPIKKDTLVDFDDSTFAICVHFGSRPEGHWKKKRWIIKYWEELFELLIQKYNNVVFHCLFGDWEEEEKEWFNNICRRSKILLEANKKRIIGYGYYKKKLPDIAHIISKCDLMISTDSGPMHIGAAVGTPVIALFGCTLPSKNKPWNSKGLLLRDRTLSCAPCLYTEKFMSCKDNICMKNITPDIVMQAVEKVKNES